TLLWHRSKKDELHWMIATEMNAPLGSSSADLARREKEIRQVAKRYGFRAVHRLGLPAAAVDKSPKNELIRKIGGVFSKAKPEIVYLPHAGDAHGDHRALAEAAMACLKWFRYSTVRRALAYETLSETNFRMNTVDK